MPRTLHVIYTDGTEADLPVYCEKLVPGLAVVKDASQESPFQIIHPASMLWIQPFFLKLSTARECLIALKPLLPSWEDIEAIRACSPETRAAVRDTAKKAHASELPKSVFPY